MKFSAVVILGIFLAVSLCSGQMTTTEAPTTTPTDPTTTATATTTGADTASTTTPAAAGGSTASTVAGETTAEGTTAAPTSPPTTEPPLDRNVAFKVDCQDTTQCAFTFKIAEQLMRYINSTYLEQQLSTLATKIQAISSQVAGLSTEESTYQTYLSDQIALVSGNFTDLSDSVTSTLETVNDLQNLTTTATDTVAAYLASAKCFQQDTDTSINCGNLATPVASY